MQIVWNELYYHVDVCRITNGAQIENLYVTSQNLGVLFH
jgi:hypothetical protein